MWDGLGYCMPGSNLLWVHVSVARHAGLRSRTGLHCLIKMAEVWVPLQDLFPFKAYFADAPGGLFKGRSYAADMERARGCWRHLRTMFQELEECRAFELLKVCALASQAAAACVAWHHGLTLLGVLSSQCTPVDRARVLVPMRRAGPGRSRQLPDDQAGQDCGDDVHACCAQAPRVLGAGLQV